MFTLALVVTKESTIRDVKDQLKAVISHDVEKKGTIGARKISWYGCTLALC